MATFAVKHFDVLEYVKKAKELGVAEPIAEFQARQLEAAIELAISSMDTKNLATKLDIKELELKIIKWVLGVGAASVIILCGAMFTMLKFVIY